MESVRAEVYASDTLKGAEEVLSGVESDVRNVLSFESLDLLVELFTLCGVGLYLSLFEELNYLGVVVACSVVSGAGSVTTVDSVIASVESDVTFSVSPASSEDIISFETVSGVSSVSL